MKNTSRNISFYLIPKSEVCYVMEEETIGQALRTIHKKGYQAVPVINSKGEYRGTVSEGDFLWTLTTEYHTDLETMKRSTVGALKKRWEYKPVSIEANITELDQYIINQNFVPVVDSRGIFIGIITRKVIISELLRQKRENEKNEGILIHEN